MAAPWGSGAQARIIGEMHGSQTVNVLNFGTNEQVLDAGQLDTILLQLAQALFDCVRETFLPAVTSDWKLVRVEAQRIYPVLSDPVVVTGISTDVGELGVASTSFIASLVNIRSGIGGRRGRGRMFLPPAGEPQIANSDIDGPTLLLIAAFLACLATKFMGTTPSTDWRLGVLSRTDLAGSIGNFDSAFRVATSLNPVATCASLRSRKKGRGA